MFEETMIRHVIYFQIHALSRNRLIVLFCKSHSASSYYWYNMDEY